MDEAHKRIHKNKTYKCKLFKKLILLSEWICQDDLTQQDSNNKIFSRRIITVSISTFTVYTIIVLVALLFQRYNIIKDFGRNTCDFLICQITSSFLIMSIISLLNEKGEAAYWTNTMTYMFKRPVVIGIRALSFYIMVDAIISIF